VPSSVIIDVGVAPVEAGATIATHDQGVRGFVIDAITAETPTSSHYDPSANSPCTRTTLRAFRAGCAFAVG
jgi:hypothetical protein